MDELLFLILKHLDKVQLYKLYNTSSIFNKIINNQQKYLIKMQDNIYKFLNKLNESKVFITEKELKTALNEISDIIENNVRMVRCCSMYKYNPIKLCNNDHYACEKHFNEISTCNICKNTCEYSCESNSCYECGNPCECNSSSSIIYECQSCHKDYCRSYTDSDYYLFYNCGTEDLCQKCIKQCYDCKEYIHKNDITKCAFCKRIENKRAFCKKCIKKCDNCNANYCKTCCDLIEHCNCKKCNKLIVTCEECFNVCFECGESNYCDEYFKIYECDKCNKSTKFCGECSDFMCCKTTCYQCKKCVNEYSLYNCDKCIRQSLYCNECNINKCLRCSN